MKTLRVSRVEDDEPTTHRIWSLHVCFERYKMRIPEPLSASIFFYLENEIARGSTIVMIDSGSIGKGVRAGWVTALF